jgi:uncharacterized protein (DUF1501 family)
MAQGVPSARTRHLLNRFSNGVTPALVRQAESRGGASRWLEWQMTPTRISDAYAREMWSWFPDLARTPAQLWQAATLIRAGVGTRVVTIDYGGWDMHTSLGTAGLGQMRSRVDEMSRALAAFFTDLGTFGERVTVVTLREFGRRVQENGAHGLDHGHGHCVLALGGGVHGGRYYGTWPGLGTDSWSAVTSRSRPTTTASSARSFGRASRRGG